MNTSRRGERALSGLLIAMRVVHPQWTLVQGQFGGLLLIVFTSIFIAGPGRLALNVRYAGALRYA